MFYRLCYWLFNRRLKTYHMKRLTNIISVVSFIGGVILIIAGAAFYVQQDKNTLALVLLLSGNRNLFFGILLYVILNREKLH